MAFWFRGGGFRGRSNMCRDLKVRGWKIRCVGSWAEGVQVRDLGVGGFGFRV